MELGEVAGQGRVLERPAGELGVEAAQSAGVRPAGVRGERRRGEAVGGRGRALAGGGHHGPGRGWRPRTSKRLMPGSSGRSSVIQTMRASTSIRQRSPGVFSGIRPMATSAIRNHTWSWSPSGSSSAPNQRLCPLGSRVGSRGVRVRGQPGRVDHRRDALFVGRVARRSTERRHQLAGRRLGGRSLSSRPAPVAGDSKDRSMNLEFRRGGAAAGSRSRGGGAQLPPRVRGRVVDGRAMGWGSGVDSRTTKSGGGGIAAPARRWGAQPTVCSRQVLSWSESFRWGRTMKASRLDGRGPSAVVGGSAGGGSGQPASRAIPNPHQGMHFVLSAALQGARLKRRQCSRPLWRRLVESTRLERSGSGGGMAQSVARVISGSASEFSTGRPCLLLVGISTCS